MIKPGHFSFPHPMVIMVAFICLAAVLTHVLPAGLYNREIDDVTGREVVVDGSYHLTESRPVGLFEMLVKIPEGFVYGADVIVFILLVGGAFYIVDKTGALNAGLSYLIARSGRATYLVLVLVGLLFSAGGALNNLQEEIVAMVPIMLVMTDKLGYRRIVAVGISAGSAVIGAAFSPVNPFQVVLAQKLAGVPLFSGAIFRIVFLLLATAFWIFWMIRYGKPAGVTTTTSAVSGGKLSIRNSIILLLVVVTFTLMVYGIVNWAWEFNQISALFFLTGTAAGLIGRLGINGTARSFAEGFREMIFAAMIVGLARSIFLVLEDGMVIDTIVKGLFTPIRDLPMAVSALGMTVAQSVLHIPVSSVSGQAVLTMPILTPVADLSGMPRQVMILAYQYGAGMTDMFTPTNGALMAILTAAGISYKEWWQFIIKPTAIIFMIAFVAILMALSFLT